MFVGGLNFNTDESTLRDHFERFGEVESVRIIYDRETSRSKGIAFVHFSEKDAEDAIQAAVERTHGIEIDGRVLLCNPAADGPKAHQREPRYNDRAARGRHDDRGRGGRDRDDSRQPRGPPSDAAGATRAAAPGPRRAGGTTAGAHAAAAIARRPDGPPREGPTASAAARRAAKTRAVTHRAISPRPARTTPSSRSDSPRSKMPWRAAREARIARRRGRTRWRARSRARWKGRGGGRVW